MPKTTVFNLNGQSTEQLELPEKLFGLKPRVHHLWRGVTTYLSNQRLGTVKTKRKGEVSGGGKKPFKQKGTGNARQGSIRAVQFVGGGIAHGPKPRDYSLGFSKKMKRQCLAESLSDKAAQGKVIVMESLNFGTPKTKQAISVLKHLGIYGKKCLIILGHSNLPTFNSFRNIPTVTVISNENLNIYEVINHDVVLLTKDSLNKLTFLNSQARKV